MDRVNRTSAPIPLSDPPEPRSRMDAPEPEPRESAPEPREDVRFDPSSALERVDQDDDETESTPLGDGLPLVIRDDAAEAGYVSEPLGHDARATPRPSGITREAFRDLPEPGGVVRAVGLQRGGGNVREAMGVDRPDRARRMLEARRAGGDMRAALGVDDDG